MKIREKKWQLQRTQEPLPSLLVFPTISLVCAVLKRQDHRTLEMDGTLSSMGSYHECRDLDRQHPVLDGVMQ